MVTINKKRLKENFPLFIMFTPVLLFFVIFKYTPMLGLIIAFKDYNLYQGFLDSPWVGLKHFHYIFSNPETVRIVKNTFVLSLTGILFGFPLPVILAILLNEVRRMWFKRSIQTLIYLPHFFSWVIISGFVFTIFNQETGIVNHVIERITGETYAFLYHNFSWWSIFIGSALWKETGFSAIIYLAALTSIDTSLYEAANLDGANKWKQIWHITIPGLASTMILILIISLGRVMEVGFDQVYVLRTPVATLSDVISTYIYRIGVQNSQFSLTTALGLFESCIGFILVLTANQIAKRYDQSLW